MYYDRGIYSHVLIPSLFLKILLTKVKKVICGKKEVLIYLNIFQLMMQTFNGVLLTKESVNKAT